MNEMLINNKMKRKSFVNLAIGLGIVNINNEKDFVQFDYKKDIADTNLGFFALGKSLGLFPNQESQENKIALDMSEIKSPKIKDNSNTSLNESTLRCSSWNRCSRHCLEQSCELLCQFVSHESIKNSNHSKSSLSFNKAENTMMSDKNCSRNPSIKSKPRNIKSILKTSSKNEASNEQLSTTNSRSKFNSNSKESISSSNSNLKTEPTKNSNTTKNTNTNSLGELLVSTKDKSVKTEVQNLKNAFIEKFQQAILFDKKSGKIRSGLKVKKYSKFSKYYGEMECGKRHGFGVTYFSNGDVCFGSFKKESSHGSSAYFHYDGSLFIGNVYEDVKKGHGKFMYLNGDLYVGEFDQNLKHGKGVYHYKKLCEVYDGNWVNGLKEKYGKWYKNNFIYKGEWKKGEFVNQDSKKCGKY